MPERQGVNNFERKSCLKRTSKIAVTVITGFLGAGKTTFINSLLKKYFETQFALVENEFGDVAIDTKLIKGVDASQMFELKDGCICCSISDEFELVLAELAERFTNVEHLLIETTGIADPASVIRPFFGDEKLRELYKFNGTVCLVDALNFKIQPEKETSVKQIAVADFVCISKSEKLTDSQKHQFLHEIKSFNPLCEIQFSSFGIMPDFQLNSDFYLPKFIPDFSTKTKFHTSLNTKSLVFERPLKKEEFTDWLSYSLQIYKNQIYRVKGILCFENEAYETILQGVGGSFEMVEGENLVSDYKSEIVFIGDLKEIDLHINF